ncbi:MAG TPA: tripartite tricarboxylate transporter substrate binding protein [Burkholderiales bacterium]|jgi:putative tricarboxylic transport membrane protein|nr:tripartite tricarboxylate transporter substrate binding protein [Burkholderiales bacterium]
MNIRFGVLLLAAIAVLPQTGLAQGYKPSRTVELVVHTGPGGGSDVLARALAVMAEREKLLPVRMIVVNKPGGNSAVAAAYLSEKRGDPNTIGLFTGVWLQTPLVMQEAKVTLRDLTPIARLVLEPAVIAVKADAPYKTLADFIDAAKKNPGKLKQSGGSNTSRDNVVRQLLQKSTGAQWAFISFPGGGERIAALIGGHVDIMVIEPEEAGEHIRAGNMRVLAQVSGHRLPGFPNAPTLKEAGFDVPVVPQVRGMVAPPGIPAANVAYWEDFCRRLTRTASWQKYIADNQFEDGYQNAADLTKFYDEFTGRMRDILKDAGVKTVR